MSESRSYLERARQIVSSVPQHIALEEHALTSVENVLFSLFLFHQKRGAYPQSVEVISWEFKRQRFEKALEAISCWAALGQSWPTLSFFRSGIFQEEQEKTLCKPNTLTVRLSRGGYRTTT
jgi:hypothetical protein